MLRELARELEKKSSARGRRKSPNSVMMISIKDFYLSERVIKTRIDAWLILTNRVFCPQNLSVKIRSNWMASLQRLPLPRVPFSFAPGFSFRHQFIESCSKQLCSEMKGIAGKMTENTLNCWFCNVFSFQLNLCVWFYVCCNRLFLKQYQF